MQLQEKPAVGKVVTPSVPRLRYANTCPAGCTAADRAACILLRWPQAVEARGPGAIKALSNAVFNSAAGVQLARLAEVDPKRVEAVLQQVRCQLVS